MNLTVKVIILIILICKLSNILLIKNYFNKNHFYNKTKRILMLTQSNISNEEYKSQTVNDLIIKLGQDNKLSQLLTTYIKQNKKNK